MERKPKPSTGKRRFDAAMDTLATRLLVMFAIYAVLNVAARRPHWIGTGLRLLVAAVGWLGI